jgi:hypothetical protein
MFETFMMARPFLLGLTKERAVWRVLYCRAVNILEISPGCPLAGIDFIRAATGPSLAQIR